jgi:hypothetical protein
LFPFFLVYLLFFSLLFSKGERNHRGTKKKVIPSAFARVSSFGFFLPEEENKRKKREEKVFCLWQKQRGVSPKGKNNLKAKLNYNYGVSLKKLCFSFFFFYRNYYSF